MVKTDISEFISLKRQEVGWFKLRLLVRASRLTGEATAFYYLIKRFSWK